MSKLTSRTFWLTVYWSLLTGLSIVGNIFFGASIPIGELVAFAGIVTTAYIGGNKYVASKGK